MTEAPCAICGRPSEAQYRPFCSSRCASEDLRRWLTGAYVMPPSDEDEPVPTEDEGD